MTTLAKLPHGRPQRLVYFGTPEMAVRPLQALVQAGFDVVLVVTRVDKRRGRGASTAASPVKDAAQQLGIAVTHHVDDCVEVGADLGVVVAFGQLIRPPILAKLPLVNLHFSLLPRWRGAAPVERALLTGDTHTGVCLMRLEEGLDTGPLFAVAPVQISAAVTAAELREQLVAVGCELLVHQLAQGLGEPVAQTGDALYAEKLRPEEFEIDWTQPAEVVQRLVRLGVAWTLFRERRLKVLSATVLNEHGEPGCFLQPLRVGCGDGSLQLETVQPEGKSPMPASSWSHGVHPLAGERLTRASK